MFRIFLFWKSWRLWGEEEKYFRAGQTTDDNTKLQHCMLDTQGYKQTLSIYYIYCFSTSTMVARTHLNVNLIRIAPLLLGVRSSAAGDSVSCDMTPRQWVIVCPLSPLHSLKWRNYHRNIFCKFGLTHLTQKFIFLPPEPDPHDDILFI